MAGFGKEIRAKGSFEEIKTKVANALKTQGFDIITEIDVQKILTTHIYVLEINSDSYCFRESVQGLDGILFDRSLLNF